MLAIEAQKQRFEVDESPMLNPKLPLDVKAVSGGPFGYP